MVWRQGSPAWARADSIEELDFAVPAKPADARSRRPAPTPGGVTQVRAALGTSETVVGRLNDAALMISAACGVGCLGVAAFSVVQSSRSLGRVSFLAHVLPILFGVVGLVSGWVFSRVGQRVVRQSRLRASNRAMFLVPGGIAALLAVAIAALLLEGRTVDASLPDLAREALGPDRVRSYVAAGAAICGLLVYAVFSAVPGLLGIDIDPDGTMGEDSVVLWSAPSRIGLASAGMQVAVLQFGCLIAAVSGMVVWRQDPAQAFDASRGGEIARWGAWVGVYSGFLPVIVYYWAVTEYLFLGTAASIHAVGRHVREQKRQGGPGGPTTTK